MEKEFDGVVDADRCCDEVRRVMADFLYFIWNIKKVAMERKVITEDEKLNKNQEISALIDAEQFVKYYFDYKEKFSICHDNPLLNEKQSGNKA